MISIRRSFIVLVSLIGLLAVAFEAISDGFDHPGLSRKQLPVEQPAPVRPADQNMDRPSSVGVREVSRPDGGTRCHLLFRFPAGRKTGPATGGNP